MNRSIFFLIIILLSPVSPGVAFEDQILQDKQQDAAPIRVGILHSLSGTMAVSEKSLVDAAMLAIEEVNERGGVLGRTLQAVIENGASNGQSFAQKAEKLIIEDKVTSVFGCWTSTDRKAVLPIFEEHNNLLWYPVQYEGRESSPNIIYSGATPNQQIIPAVDWCRREFGTRVFLIGSDYIFPRIANEIIRMRLDDFGGTVIGEEYRPLGSQDFDELVAKIIDSKPDVVLSTINGDSNRGFFSALKKSGIDQRQIPVLSFSIAEHEVLDIGVELTAGHYASWTYFQSIDTPANRRFVRKFKGRYGAERVTDDPIEAAYSQVHMFAKAVESARSTDVDAIRRAVRGLVFPTPGGLIRVDPRNQHTWKVAHIGRIQSQGESKGQFRILWSSEDPLPPQPFLPATFIFRGNESGSIMFDSISAMIDLEIAELDVSGRKPAILMAMANVRGFLGDARAKFRNATSVVNSANRTNFELAWQEFESRLEELSGQQEMLSDQQLSEFEQFGMARKSYAENAVDMMKALYQVDPTDNEVIP